MKTVAIGGNSRSVGKTSLAVSIISATRELGWTAVKITQFGHGICSRNGEPCGCATSDPLCPYEISVEDGAIPSTDTARMLAAGAREVLWVRTGLGNLETALPEMRQRLEGREHVLFESNGIVEHWRPSVYLSVLDCSLQDCKASALRSAGFADAFVLSGPDGRAAPWKGFDADRVGPKRVFSVAPPEYCSPELLEFARKRL